MAEVSVYIPDEELPRFERVMRENGFAYEKERGEIPEWQKEEVRKSIAETKEVDYIPWEEVKRRTFRNGK